MQIDPLILQLTYFYFAVVPSNMHSKGLSLEILNVDIFMSESYTVLYPHNAG